MKYRSPGESFGDKCIRIANALKDSPDHFDAFRDILREMRFLPAGRVQSAMGSHRRVTGYNCFVSGTLPDSMDGIMTAAREAAETMRRGGGIGFDFSTLRPRGDLIVTLDSRSSGPVSFMHIFDAVCQTIASAGHRRGAMMAVLRVDHPDIARFVRAKQNDTQLRGFNISIAVTDAFMHCLLSGRPFPLTFGGRTYEEVDPQALWNDIMRSNWEWAEPGVMFIDTINRMNNLAYTETIAATNPCGEVPLPPYGACLLGSFNLTKYLAEGHPGEFYFDWGQLKADIPHVVRAMDNVIDRTTYPLPQQEAEAKAKRRMGLGVTGLANAAEIQGFAYGTEEFLKFQRAVLTELRDGCYRASAHLAAAKGAFKLFDSKMYLEGGFIRTLPGDIRDLIRKHGIRNSHLLSIAPTGTISLTADNISSGVEPPFSLSYDRTIQTFDGPRVEAVQDYAFRTHGVRGKTAKDCSAQDHVRVLNEASRFVDAAVSKTCNVSPDMAWDDFKQLYIRAWEGGAKGITTFNAGGKRSGVLTEKNEEGATACFIDPTTGLKECA